MSLLKGDNSFVESSVHRAPVCSSHITVPEFFCNTCKVPICVKVFFSYDQCAATVHNGHKTIELSHVTETKARVIIDQSCPEGMDLMLARIAELKEAISRVNYELQEVKENGVKVCI